MGTTGRRLRHHAAARRSSLAALSMVMVLGAGCGGGDDEGPAGSASDPGVGADSAASSAKCTPVGEELGPRAIKAVPIQLQDFAFSPSTVKVDAGVVTFAANNAGSENHELAFLPGGGEVPLTAEGEPDEDALSEAGAFELEAFGPGQSCSATYELKPGTYTLFCIVTSSDGKTHFEKGMRGQVVVS